MNCQHPDGPRNRWGQCKPCNKLRARATRNSKRRSVIVDLGYHGIAEERFWRFVAPMTEGRGCWEWMGAHSRGRAMFDAGNGMVQASRMSWEMHNGPIPDGIDVCHHCDNGSCVNPSHFFLGTHLDNMADRERKGRNRIDIAIAAAAEIKRSLTHCKYGHEYTPANTRIKQHRGRLYRQCRACDQIAWTKNNARRAECAA